jgi:hypothetical protein
MWSDVDIVRRYVVQCVATSTVPAGQSAVYGAPRVHSISGAVTPAVFPVWQGGAWVGYVRGLSLRAVRHTRPGLAVEAACA